MSKFSLLLIMLGLFAGIVNAQNPVSLSGKGTQTKENQGKTLARAKSYTMSGLVKDKANGEVLIGATVYIRSLGKGTVTNEYGFYSLTVSYNFV